MKILVVENNPTDRFILEKVLSSKYDLVLFGLSQEALEYASANTFDVALINIHLINHWEGIEFLQDLKKNSLRDFTSIAMTSDIFEGSTEKIMEAGFDVILLTPITAKSILRAIVKPCG